MFVFINPQASVTVWHQIQVRIETWSMHTHIYIQWSLHLRTHTENSDLVPRTEGFHLLETSKCWIPSGHLLWAQIFSLTWTCLCFVWVNKMWFYFWNTEFQRNLQKLAYLTLVLPRPVSSPLKPRVRIYCLKYVLWGIKGDSKDEQRPTEGQFPTRTTHERGNWLHKGAQPNRTLPRRSPRTLWKWLKLSTLCDST